MIRVFLATFILMNSFLSTGQTTDEETKVFLFTSVFSDGSQAYSINWDKWNYLLQNNYDFFTFKCSSWNSLILPSKENVVYKEYQIKIYKIPDNNSFSQSRYLLHYKDVSSNVRLRMAGFVENDMKVFFKYLESKSVSKKQLYQLIAEWKRLDSLFTEIDLDCILDGYLKNSTKSDCFKAVHYIRVNDFSIGFTPLKKNELNSCFSRLPLYGYFEEYKNGY